LDIAKRNHTRKIDVRPKANHYINNHPGQKSFNILVDDKVCKIDVITSHSEADEEPEMRGFVLLEQPPQEHV